MVGLQGLRAPVRPPQLKPYTAAAGCRRADAEAASHREVSVDAVPKPPRAVRSENGPQEMGADPVGKVPVGGGPFAASHEGPAVAQQGVRVHQPLPERAFRRPVDLRRGAEDHRGGPRDNGGLRARLVQQRGTLQRRLPCSHHGHALSRERREVHVVRRVGDQSVVDQMGQHGRHIGESDDSHGEYHGAAAELLTGIQGDPKSRAGHLFHVAHRHPFQLGYRMLLEPESVPHELGDGHRVPLTAELPALGGTEIREPPSWTGCGNGRRERGGFEVHTPRHMGTPAVHRLAENPKRNLPGLQVGGRGQTVRPGTDDRNRPFCSTMNHMAKL